MSSKPDLRYIGVHIPCDTTRSGMRSLDEAIEWGLTVVGDCPEQDADDKSVSVYVSSERDRIAVIYPFAVVVNSDYGTAAWPVGWTYLEEVTA